MKKFIVLPMIALLAIPAFAGSTKTTTTRTYDSTTTAPATGPVTAPIMDSEMNSEMIEAEEDSSYGETLDQDAIEQERMEERMVEEQKMEDSSDMSDDDLIDYSDRTRTNRERKALNTGNNASDDH